MQAQSEDSAPAIVRLHISPLTPATLPILVPAALQATLSSAVEYHEITTFPERSYGYLELPAPEAQKLRKRLNGTRLKGLEVKAEEARPKNLTTTTCNNDDLGSQTRRSERLRDFVKSREGVVLGVQLPGSRHIKRGWTEPVSSTARRDSRMAKKDTSIRTVDKRKSKKSEFTDKEELLFKTKKAKPAAAALNDPESTKKRKRGDESVVIHEFEHNTKFPTFLKSQGQDNAPTTEFDPEKGWVDSEGKVIEGPRRSSRRHSQASNVRNAGTVKKAKDDTKSVVKAAKSLSLRGKGGNLKHGTPPATAGSTSSSASSEVHGNEQSQDRLQGAVNASNSDGEETADELSAPPERSRPGLSITPTPALPTLEVQPSSAITATPTTATPTTASTTDMHPLEALFKKPKGNSRKPRNLELKIPFSFFGNNEGDIDNEEESEMADQPSELPIVPATPFTQADLRFRRERSAAPTPDTAAPTKLLFGSVLDRIPVQAAKPEQGSDDESDGVEEGGSGGDEQEADETQGAGAGARTRSDFAEKWFWEKRGENNRAWKKRRREVAKSKRHSENKRRTRSSAS